MSHSGARLDPLTGLIVLVLSLKFESLNVSENSESKLVEARSQYLIVLFIELVLRLLLHSISSWSRCLGSTFNFLATVNRLGKPSLTLSHTSRSIAQPEAMGNFGANLDFVAAKKYGLRGCMARGKRGHGRGSTLSVSPLMIQTLYKHFLP